MRNVCLSREHSGTARTLGGSSGRWGRPAAAKGHGASPGDPGPLSMQPSGCTQSLVMARWAHCPPPLVWPGTVSSGYSTAARGSLFPGPWSPSAAVSPASPALHPARPPRYFSQPQGREAARPSGGQGTGSQGPTMQQLAVTGPSWSGPRGGL